MKRETVSLFVMGAALALVPACSRESAPAPAPSAPSTSPVLPAVAGHPGSAPAASVAAPAPRRAVVEGPLKDGRRQRGIVRAGPSFTAAEVTRLETGTPVFVVGVEPGGWYRVGWPYPDGAERGFLHGDVLRGATER